VQIEAGFVFLFRYEGASTPHWRSSNYDDLVGSLAGNGTRTGAEPTPERFGEALDFENGVLLVGAPFEDEYDVDAGVFYYFSCSGAPATCSEQGPINENPVADQKLGMDLSISGIEVLVGTDDERAMIYEGGGGAPFYYIEDHELSDNPAVDRGFGLKVSFSGTSALIGAKYDDDGGIDSGAVYVFDVNEFGGYEQKQKLVASSPQAYAEFGTDVAHDGDNALIGSARYDTDGFSAAGLAYTFSHDGTDWNEDSALTAVAPTVADEFGSCVAISGDYALVGARLDDSRGADAGRAYIFETDGAGWSLAQRLAASDFAATEEFGTACDLDHNTALIGSKAYKAYVFYRSGGVWSEQAKLSSAGPVNELFGRSVAVDGDSALVGAASNDIDFEGAAYVYTRSGSSWGLQQSLPYSGTERDFGSAVDLDGDTAVVGGIGPGVGVYVRSGSTWTEQQLISPAGASSGFGDAVAVSGDTLLVGNWNANGTAGEAVIYERTGDSWSEGQTLSLNTPEVNDYFGFSVDLIGTHAFVSETNDTPGSVHVYARAGTGWLRTRRIGSIYANLSFDNGLGTYGVQASGNRMISSSPTDKVAFINEFDCGFGAAIQAGRWNMIGIPCDLGTSNTVADVFGDNFDTARYNHDWTVFRRDAANERYVRLGLTSALSQGEGYWLYSYDWATWDATATATATTWMTSGTCASPTGCYEVSLTKPADSSSHRFVMVGHPGSRSANWSGVTLMVDGMAFTPYDAEFNNYLSKTIWKWNGASYDTWDDGTTPGMEGTLYSHEGFWVKVLGESFNASAAPSLLIPDQVIAGGPPGPPGMAAASTSPEQVSFESSKNTNAGRGGKQKAPEEWYIRLSASGDGLQDRSNVLGQMISSEDGPDARDLEELRPEFSPYLTIVFPHEDWQTGVRDYTSDYHDVEMGRYDSWDFEVRSDATWRDVTITWDRPKMVRSYWNDQKGRWAWAPDTETNSEPLMARMWLMDVDSGTLIKAEDDGALNRYSFNMEGSQVRHFRWIYSKKGNPAKR
jgi:hypothetical protein